MQTGGELEVGMTVYGRAGGLQVGYRMRLDGLQIPCHLLNQVGRRGTEQDVLESTSSIGHMRFGDPGMVGVRLGPDRSWPGAPVRDARTIMAAGPVKNGIP